MFSGTVKVNFTNTSEMCFFPRKIWRNLANFFYLATKSLICMEPVGNNESPLQEVFQQITGLHTYRDHTLIPMVLISSRILGFLSWDSRIAQWVGPACAVQFVAFHLRRKWLNSRFVVLIHI